MTLETDGIALAGTLTLPTEPAAPLVIGVHGAEGSTRQFHLFRHLESTLPPAGVATLVFDRRGEGESGGDGSASSYEQFAADVRAWMRFCAADKRVDPARIGLWGISQGGWIAPLAAASSPAPAFLVAVSAAGVTPGKQMSFATRALLREAGYGDEAVDQMLALRRAMDELSLGRMSVSDAQGAVRGGHLMPGCIVRTTAEVVIALLPGWEFRRELDVATGFRELAAEPEKTSQQPLPGGKS